MDVKQIIAESLDLPVANISDHDSAEMVENWDSLATIRIALAIEAALGVSLSTEDILTLNSVPAVKAIAEKHGAGTRKT